MKKIILTISIFCLIILAEQNNSPKFRSPDSVLRLGEKFTFNARVAGYSPEANIYLWTDSLFHEINGDSCYRFIFYTKINHSLISIRESKIESYARKTDLITLKEEQYLLEKGKEKWRIINFDPEKGIAHYKKDSTVFFDGRPTIDSSNITIRNRNYLGIHDMINIFWYLRLIEIDSFVIGDTFYIWSFIESRKIPYRLPVVILREETIEVPAGTFNCYVVNCCVRKTKLFSANSGDMTIWISKDEKRIIAQMTRKEKVFFSWQTVFFKLKAIE